MTTRGRRSALDIAADAATDTAPADGKAVPQQPRSRRTYAQILDAANHEFAEHGVAGTTTTAIAARADVSIGALYRFFADKQAIADALCRAYLDDAAAAFTPCLDGVAGPADIEPAMRALVRHAADLQLAHPGYYRLAQELRPDGEDSPAHVVRTALVAAFERTLDRVGIDHPGPAERRRVVEMAIETVRHTLATIGPSGRTRRAHVDELEAMVVAYVTTRFDLPAG